MRIGPTTLAVLALAFVGRPAVAGNERAAECVAAFEKGQDLRSQARLTAAREQFLSCAREACPAMIRKDCSEAAEDLVRETPSIVVGARAASGEDLLEVTLSIDGGAPVHPGPGQAQPLDPGPHRLVLEHEGYAPITKDIVVLAGERDRVLVAVFRHDVDQGRPSRSPEPRRSAASPASSATTVGYVAAGAGVLGFVLGLVAGGIAVGSLADARAGCVTYPTRCSPAGERANDRATSWATASTVSITGGVLLLALGIGLVLTSPPSSQPMPAQASWSAPRE